MALCSDVYQCRLIGWESCTVTEGQNFEKHKCNIVQCLAHLHFHRTLEVAFGMESEILLSQDGTVPVTLLTKTINMPSSIYFYLLANNL